MNIIDYCEWRGDLSFKADPFNLVDNLCISQMAYVPFDSLLMQKETKTIKELSRQFFNSKLSKEMIESKSFVSDTPYALKAMGETLRFKDCKVYNYVSILHSETTEQFAAMMIDIPDGTTVIAFRGTDDTLIGWHEDLLLSYTVMPAQIDAVNYINKYAKPFHKYRILGHSKGGNLAIYAAINCKPSIQNRIIQIISNDGPGLRPETYSKETYNKLADRYLKIVPEYDLFGTIYDNAKNKLVVKSDQKDFLQHSGMSWQVIGNSFNKASDVDHISKSYKLGFDKFMVETTIEQRSEMISELFKYLKEANINNISDFANGGLPVMLKAFKAIAELKPEAKEAVKSLIKIFTDAQAEDINRQVNESKEYVYNKAQKLGTSIETIFNETVSSLEKKLKK